MAAETFDSLTTAFDDLTVAFDAVAAVTYVVPGYDLTGLSSGKFVGVPDKVQSALGQGDV